MPGPAPEPVRSEHAEAELAGTARWSPCSATESDSDEAGRLK